MTAFNILTESFITNNTVVNQRLLNAQEVSALIALSGNILTFSGSTISLLLDLGYQRSLDKLEYSFTPISISGLNIEYGRDLNNLISGTLNIAGNSIYTNPTISGYTYPRYFKITHITPSGSPLTLSGLQVINSQDEVEFGESGTLPNLTIVSNEETGFSQVQEIPVFNNGTIASDFYVAIETSNLNKTVFERLEIAPTSTGTFATYNDFLSIPEEAPWQWGVFSGVVVDDNKLKLTEPNFVFPNYTIGQTYTRLGTNNRASNINIIALTLSNGDAGFAFADTSNRIILVNPVRDSFIVSSNPAVAPAGNPERGNHHLAWDGADKIFYMNNSTDQTVRYYSMSTNTHGIVGTAGFYTRAVRTLAYHDGWLYVIGASSSAGSNTTIGTEFWRFNVNTLVSQQLAAPSALENAQMVYYDGYIYYTKSPNTPVFFARYNILTNSWQYLSNPVSSTYINITVDYTNKGIVAYMGNDNVYRFNTITEVWEASPIATTLIGTITANSVVGLGVGDSLLYVAFNVIVEQAKIKILSEVPEPVINATVSGTWISPVYRLAQEDLYHRILLDYELESGARIKFDSSIGVDNFQIRGSDSAPAFDNTIETFDQPLDPEVFIFSKLNQGTTIVSSGNKLAFTHDFLNSLDTPFLTGYVTYGFPLSSAGKMQYKFYWNPSSNKAATVTHLSKFYIVPFLNSLDGESLPLRSLTDSTRTENNNIYLQFGQASDSGGTFTILSFFTGLTTINYTINASSGNNYEVALNIDWDTGNFIIRFNGTVLGSGTLPAARVQLLNPQHSYEFLSASTVDSQEEFSYLTINRVGLVVAGDDTLIIPTHFDDPLFGLTGSLTWTPVTVNSALIPKYKYVQFKLTLVASGKFNKPTVTSIKFPKVLKLTSIEPNSAKSVYLRYNFPSSNELATNTIYLKSWTATDKI